MSENALWYTYEFKAYTKERWIGRKLIDVLSSEFKRRIPLYFEKAVIAGAVRVNGVAVSEGYILKHGDLITHTTHRHEPPIPSDEISVVFDSEDIIVVDKPSGIPCHPNSSYNKNSLTEIVKKSHHLKFISALNRLDRQTSGIVILAKNSRAAAEYHKKIEEKEGFKIYLCRVRGIFPSNMVIANIPLSISRSTCTTTIFERDGALQGKKSITIFKKISEDRDSTILACGLITGRTHQIRVHLQAIGFPIVDDMIYRRAYVSPTALLEHINSICTSEPIEPKAKKTEPTEQCALMHIEEKLIEIDEDAYIEMCRKEKVALSSKSSESLISAEEHRTDRFQDDPEYLKQIPTENTAQFTIDSCAYCRNENLLQVIPKFSAISLHAWRYTFNEHTFKTSLPKWCMQEIDGSVCSEIEAVKEKMVRTQKE